MWTPITVIAPDLPGIGDLSIPSDGIGMKTAAIQIPFKSRWREISGGLSAQQ